MRYQFDWGAVFEPTLWLSAIGVTLSYAIGTIVVGMLLGIVCGIALLSPRAILRWPPNAYVQFFRCTPLMVQIVWFYYALPILSGIRISAWIAAGLGLALYMGAFCAEIFRGGIISIEKGQWNAARALGMSQTRMMLYIILPQALRRMVPPFVNQCVLQLKNTSLLYVVAVPDIMYSSYQITAQTYRPLEVYTLAALIYFLLLFPLAQFSKKLEARVDR
jgi:polar amino acid transport system permease protein